MSLIAELKRRNVFRVGAAYAIIGWLLVEVASVLLPTFDAPDWVMKAFSSLVILGFPLALIFAWAFELTPEGIKRETAVDSDESITHAAGRKLDFAIIGPPLGGSLLNRIMWLSDIDENPASIAYPPAFQGVPLRDLARQGPTLAPRFTR